LKIIDEHTIEVFGKKYPMEKRGSRRFIITEFSPTDKPVQVFDDNLISKKLKKAKVESTEKLWEKIINIKSKSGDTGFDYSETPTGLEPKDEDVARYLGMGIDSFREFRKGAKAFGIEGTEKRLGKATREKQPSKKREQFMKDELIRNWIDSESGIGNKAASSKSQFINNLYKALRIMDLTPSEFADKEGGSQKERFDRAADRMQVVRDFSNAPIALDPTAKVKGKEVPKMQKKSKLWDGGDAMYYSFVMPVRSFLKDQGGLTMQKITNKEHNLAASVVGHGKHAKVKADFKQIDELKKCAKEKNSDVYMLVLLGLTTGLRKIEALTIPFKNVSLEGKDKFGNPLYSVKIFNRKTQHALGYAQQGRKAKDEAYHLADIYDIDTNLAIQERLKNTKEGLLIGSLDRTDPNNFIRPDQIESTGKDEQIQDDDAAIKKLLTEPLIECYKEIGLIPPNDEREEEKIIKGDQIVNTGKMIPKFESGYDQRNYFYRKPMHALRHIFAQFWLDVTEWNYGDVAKLGHWKTISELEASYGEMPRTAWQNAQVTMQKQKHQRLGTPENVDKNIIEKNAARQWIQDNKEEQLTDEVKDEIEDLEKKEKKQSEKQDDVEIVESGDAETEVLNDER
tara:strand:+ start:3449 stop:5320 length:1872 start_codon:yes stop_codon:yes gene_type:complete